MVAPDPTLSVVVPCHNAARFLPVTLASAEFNAAADVEWVFVNDGSTDSTGALLKAYRPSAGSAIVLTHPVARGLAGARNEGTAAAHGRYVTYLDADDWLAPGYLRRMIDAIEQLKVDFVRTDHVQVFDRRREAKLAPEPRRWQPIAAHEGIGTIPNRSTMVDYPYAWSAIYDMSLRERGLLHVDEAIKTAEDRLMCWRLHLHAESFAVVEELGYFYRREVAGSLTQIGDERQLHFFDSFDRVADEVLHRSEFEQFRVKFVRNYLAVIVHHRYMRRRMHHDIYRRFLRRASTTIRAFPAALLEDAIVDMEPERQRAVLRLA